MPDDLTLTVPAEYADAFREDVYVYYSAHAETLHRRSIECAAGDRDRVTDLRIERAELQLLEELLDQVGWEYGTPGPVELHGAPSTLQRVMASALAAAGEAVHQACDSNRPALDRVRATLARAEWAARTLEQIDGAATTAGGR